MFDSPPIAILSNHNCYSLSYDYGKSQLPMLRSPDQNLMMMRPSDSRLSKITIAVLWSTEGNIMMLYPSDSRCLMSHRSQWHSSVFQVPVLERRKCVTTPTDLIPLGYSVIVRPTVSTTGTWKTELCHYYSNRFDSAGLQCYRPTELRSANRNLMTIQPSDSWTLQK